MTIPLFVFVCLSSMRQRRQEPPLSIARLNRLLLERSEISCGDDVVLASNDDRAVHVREQIWRSKQSEKIPDATLRVGVVNGGVVDDCRARLSANGDVILDGRVLRELGDEEAVRPRLDLVLALPAPLRLKRILPMVSSLGIDSLYLVGTQRSDRAFFGSSLLRGFQTYKKNDLDFAPVQAPLGTDFRNLLIEGAEQSGSTAIPHVAVVSSLSTALRNLPGDDENCVRCAAHPDRGDGFRALDDRTGEYVEIPRSQKISRVICDEEKRRVVLAVGPERGWEEPGELNLLTQHNFQLVTLGRRTLRTDVALVALIALIADKLR